MDFISIVFLWQITTPFSIDIHVPLGLIIKTEKKQMFQIFIENEVKGMKKHNCHDCYKCFSKMPANIDVEWEIGDKCKHLHVVNIAIGSHKRKSRYICTQGFFNHFSRIKNLSLAAE